MPGSTRDERLSRTFYARDATRVARDLLGQRLVRRLGDGLAGGLICETEAYGGPEDLASHARTRTSRSAIMYGPAGYAYVYFIYGTHYCLNVVTGCDGCAGAVLIRAIIPDEGVALMRRLRKLPEPATGPHPLSRVADGPGKLCQALAITGEHNGLDLVTNDVLFLTAEPAVPDAEVMIGPRVGVRGDEEALRRPWRYAWLGDQKAP